MKTIKKTSKRTIALVMLLTVGLFFVYCSNNDDGGSGGSGTSASPPPIPMITVPTNGSTTITFPMKTDDSGSGTINHKFAMAQTEVTYKLWKKVYDWANKDGGACDSATGQYCYTFAHAGTKGGMYSSSWLQGNLTGSDKQPVTVISWRDSIVWCNAYTEWYNAVKGGSLGVVYKKGSGVILRDSEQSVENDVGNTFDPTSNTATGFRLPTSVEWEYAARLRKDATNTVADGKPTSTTKYPMKIGGTNYWFTKGNSASGATADYNDVTETGKVAWYIQNSCDDGTGCAYNNSGTKKSKSQDVATKAPNALGLYDMSGNVHEWCFNISNGDSKRRKYHGGSWGNDDTSIMQIGKPVSWGFAGSSDRGFRVARTVP